MRVIAIAVLAMFAVAPVAGAHTLTVRKAQQEAERVAVRTGVQVGAVGSVGTCRRQYRSSAPAHVVDCIAVYRFAQATCRRTIRVKFVSPSRSRLKTRHLDDTACKPN